MGYLQGQIIYLDSSRNRFDAMALNGSAFFSDVEYLDTGMTPRGETDHPEIGDMVVLRSMEDGRYELEKYYHQRAYDENGLPASKDKGADAGQNLSPTLPGDWQRRGPDGAFLSILRGMTLAQGASPMCQTIYLGLEGLIRTVCQNYEAIGSGFRVFSINDGGEVVTRICFSSKDHFVSRGVNDNTESNTENFEFQFDITADGFTLFAGEINPDNGKRVNNLILNINQSGDLKLSVGNKIILSIFDNGCASFDVIDDSGAVLYNKSVSSDGIQALVTETLTGNYIRNIQGNMTDYISDTYQRKCSNEILISDISDKTMVLNKTSASVNVKDLEPAPSATFRLG